MCAGDRVVAIDGRDIHELIMEMSIDEAKAKSKAAKEQQKQTEKDDDDDDKDEGWGEGWDAGFVQCSNRSIAARHAPSRSRDTTAANVARITGAAAKAATQHGSKAGGANGRHRQGQGRRAGSERRQEQSRRGRGRSDGLVRGSSHTG